MAERLRAEEAKRLAHRVKQAEGRVASAKSRYEEWMAARAMVFLEVFDAGLTIPEIAEAADRSAAMVSISLADARKRRAEGDESVESA